MAKIKGNKFQVGSAPVFYMTGKDNGQESEMNPSERFHRNIHITTVVQNKKTQ